VGTWSRLNTELPIYLERDLATDYDLFTILPTVIESAQKRIYREWAPVVALNTSTYQNTSAGTATIARDTSIVGTIALSVRDNDGRYRPLELRDLAWVQEWWPNPTLTGLPRYAAHLDVDEFLLAPTPDATYQVRSSFRKMPTLISAAAEDNALTLLQYDGVLAACLVEATLFLMEDRKEAVRAPAEEAYQRVKAGVLGTELARNKAARDGGPTKAD
jgi:hypothetical protein